MEFLPHIESFSSPTNIGLAVVIGIIGSLAAADNKLVSFCKYAIIAFISVPVLEKMIGLSILS